MLFNLAYDIGEKNNLEKYNPEKIAEMSIILKELLINAVPTQDPSAKDSTE